MRKVSGLQVLWILAALGLAPPATAGTGTWVLVDFQGFAWESGGFRPSDAGDTLRIPLVVNDLSANLGVDLGSQEVTGWIDGLVSQGEEVLQGTILRVRYGSGRILFVADPDRDHAFGVDPPNASVPARFVDGDTCLAGEVHDFTLYMDLQTGSGAMQAQVAFDRGRCLTAVQALRAEGFTFAGFLTRTASTTVPHGYDLALDGLLEAVGVTPAACPFECIELVAARLEFPRRPDPDFDDDDGAFRIDGVFTPCETDSLLVPARERVVVRIGSFTQVLPPGSMELEDDFDDADREWEFLDPGARAALTEVEIELEADGAWEFELFGRGIPRQRLLGSGTEVEVELQIGERRGIARARLEQRRTKLVFDRGDERPCGSGIHHPIAPYRDALPVAGPRLTRVVPNPFNARATLEIVSPFAETAAVEIFDARGRRVRLLAAGRLPAGRTTFVWDGRDDQGHEVASGIYLGRVRAGSRHATRRLVVVK